MNENDFEGTLVLEKIAQIGKLDSFMEAIDSDDLHRIKSIMKKANIDAETISTVLKKVIGADEEH